ncbi:MAG: T9SS type A sorting domain-containing protein, partial [Saprospiraceae bacterium]
MSLNGGLGAVVEKNQVIIDDILTVGQITATKHSNGRDWWILFRKYESNQYYRILVSPNGIENLGLQEIGLPFNNGVGQAVFSPDGSKYINYVTKFISEGNLINIYDFDRCTGLLSNPIQTTNNDSIIGSGGAALSSNSRYLYLSANHYIYQYDLHSNDIFSTKDTVAEYDGYQIPITPTFGLSTRFFLMQLAPNGKIYINIPNGVNLLHVINNPNEEGENCNVLQHSIELPTYNAFSLPNFPNYKLGAEVGSICDTITSIEDNLPISKFNVKAFPNPTPDYINFQIEFLDKEDLDISIYNIMGQKVFSYFVEKNINNFKIDLSDFPTGTYFYKLKNDKILIHQGKFIIQR